MQKILNICIDIVSNSYRHYITNNFENLLKKKDGSKNTPKITTLILVKIVIYIKPIEFLDAGVPQIVFSPDKKI